MLCHHRLVTAEGQLWKRQRSLIGAAFRVEILSEVRLGQFFLQTGPCSFEAAQAASIAVEATERLVAKLEHFVKNGGGGAIVEMGEEFRLLTLQVGARAFSMRLFPWFDGRQWIGR